MPISRATAAAEPPLPEIVVTAQLREASALATPASVSVLTEEVIAARQAQHFEELLGALPNVNFAAGSNRARYFQLRGMGERSQFVDPINPSVGLLIDQVDFSGAGALATLVDVKQVEVLRGPQGTRYGANALAGLVSITTHAPTSDFALRAKATWGGYGTGAYSVVLNGPLSKRANARLALARHQSDGYTKNVHLNREDTNGRDEATARARLSLVLSDSWQMGMTLARVETDNGYDAFSLDNTRQTLSDEPGDDAQTSRYLALSSEWQLGAVRVEAYANAAESDIRYGYDEDWTYLGYPEYPSTAAYLAALARDGAAAPEPSGYASTDLYLRARDTASIEARLVSTRPASLGSAQLDWLAGLYHLRSDEALRRVYTYAPQDFLSDFGFDALAGFFQLDLGFGQGTSLHLGLRSERKDTAYDDSAQARFAKDYSLWGGRLALRHRLAGGTLLYASAARGYKAGGFNSAGTLPGELRQFDDEQLLQYELGWKGQYADGRLEAQLALFYGDRQDQQARTHHTLVRGEKCLAPGEMPLDAADAREPCPVEFIELLRNAADGSNRGLEASLRWAATERLAATASIGWLDAEFDAFEYVDSGGERQDLSNRDQAHAPNYTFSLGLRYKAGGWQASISADGKDAYYFSDTHNTRSQSALVFNASLAYTHRAFTLTLWARNLTDEDTQVRGFFFGNAPPAYTPASYHQQGEPRILGLTFEYAVND